LVMACHSVFAVFQQRAGRGRRSWPFWLVCALLFSTYAMASAKPARLIVLSPHLVELVYSIGAGEQIIATVAHADYPAAARQLPVVGDYRGLQLEQIVSLQPDVVLYWRAGTPAQDVEQLEKLGIKVLGFDANTPADIAASLRQLGQLLQLTARTEPLARQTEQQLSQIKQRWQQASKVRVFYELWDQPLSSIGPGAWPAHLLQLCGAENLLADAAVPYPQLSAELLFARQPQLILQPVSKGEPRTLVDWQGQFSQLEAVRHQQIQQIDADALHRATRRTVAAIEQLCQQIDQSRQYWQRQQRSATSGLATATQ
jgi:vitamin B12 transport system substrate-binding protein